MPQDHATVKPLRHQDAHCLLQTVFCKKSVYQSQNSSDGPWKDTGGKKEKQQHVQVLKGHTAVSAVQVP